MDAENYIETLYSITTDSVGKDINSSHAEENTNIIGYFPRLRAINDKILDINDEITGVATDLIEYKAKLEVAKTAYDAAVNGLAEVTEDLLALTTKTNISEVLGISDPSDEIQGYLKQYEIYVTTKATEEKNKASYETVVAEKQSAYDTFKNTLQGYYNQKISLNKKFYSTYSRFIQEGTWISDEHIDDEKYYIDAQSVMYNSCFP